MRLHIGLVVLVLGSVALGYTPPAGFQKTGGSFPASAIAFSPDGKVAVAQDSFAGGASIQIFPSLADVGTTPLQTFTDPTWKFIAGIEFNGENQIVFGENGTLKTVLQGSIASGSAIPLAPSGSVPNINDLTLSGSSIYAVAANGPAANDLISIPLAGGLATIVIHDFGNGYGGGVAVRSSGEILLTDSNDPAFTGHAGQVLRYSPAYAPLGVIDLTDGNGAGAVDLALDSEGDILVSTGSTLTRIPAGSTAAQPFGSFDAFSFPTFLSYRGSQFEPSSGDGILLVSGFTDETAYASGAFAITPLPEPGGLFILVGTLALVRRRVRR